MFSVPDIIDIAVKLEKNGENRYRKAIASHRSDELKALLAWMVEEEVKHAQWFMELKAKVALDEEMIAMREMNQKMLGEFIGKQAFSLNEVNFDLVEKQNELIKIFIEFENDTILFYEMLCAFAAPETQRQLAVIIDEEKRHVAQLQHAVGHSASLTAVGDPA